MFVRNHNEIRQTEKYFLAISEHPRERRRRRQNKIQQLREAEYMYINEQNSSFSAHYVIRSTGSANSK